MTITVFAALVALVGVLASRTGLLRAQVIFCLFGATTAVGLPALGGAVIVVPVLCLPFVVLRAFNESYGTGAIWHMSKAGFWLLTTVVWGLLVTLFVPRLMQGQFDIITVDRLSADGAALKPIGPVSGNVSQSVYAMGNVAMFVAARHLMRTQERMLVFGQAMLWLATLNCAAALLNLAQFHLGFPDLLTYVRTAYATFTAFEARGTSFVRIHGTFPEASVFAAFSLTMFAYTVNLWLSGFRPRWSGTVALMLLLFLGISTSTTAYLGLTLYLGILGLSLLRKAYMQGRLPKGAFLFAVVVFFVLVAGALFVFETPVAKKVSDLLNVSVFNKLESQSAQTRGEWNMQAWQNVWDSYGIGVGFGSARASSFLLTLMSNVGLVGTLTYGLFLWATLRRPPGAEPVAYPATAVAQASGHAVMGSLCAALLAGPAFDRGTEFYLLAAAASLQTVLVERRYAPVPQRAYVAA